MDGEVPISSYEFLTTYRSLLNIDDLDQLVYTGYLPDEDSYFMHIRFKQVHDSVPVHTVSVSFAEQDNIIHSIIGNLVKGITDGATPDVSEPDAFRTALDEVTSAGTSEFM